jgi:hypothetical protein
MPMPIGRSISVSDAGHVGQKRWHLYGGGVLKSLKEIFPVQSSIFSTGAISRWKKKWIGLGR